MFSTKFKEIIIEHKDFLGICLIGKDGILVESLFEEDNEELIIELSEIANKTSQIWENRGEVLDEEILISSSNNVIIKRISDFYFLIFTLKKTANIGKARFIIRKNLSWFQKEIQ